MKNHEIVKYLAAGLFAVAFLGAVIWLVRSEGERTRQALREASQQAGAQVREGIKEGVNHAADKAAEMPGKVLRDVKDVLVGNENSGPAGDENTGDGRQAKNGERPGKTDQKRPRTLIDQAAEAPGKVLRDAKDVLFGTPEKPANSQPPSLPPAETPAKPTAEKPVAAEKPVEKPAAPSQVESDKSPGDEPAAQQPPIEKPVDVRSQPDKVESPETVMEKPKSRPVSGSQQPAPDTAADRVEPPAAPTKPTPKKPTDIIGDLFEAGHELSKSIDEVGQDMLGLSPEEEIRLGPEVHRIVRQQCKIVNSPVMVRRLEQLAQPLLELRTRKNLKYSFLVIDSAEVNAFAHVGGYVYVNRGMLKFVRNDAELQFVLAHEIAHGDLKHCAKQVTYAARASQLGGNLGGNLAQLAYRAIATGYTKDHEFEADAWAFRTLLRIDRSRDEALSLSRHLVDYVKGKGLEPEQRDPKNASQKTAVEITNHFRSHPPSADRVRRLESLNVEPSKTANQTSTKRLFGGSSLSLRSYTSPTRKRGNHGCPSLARRASVKSHSLHPTPEKPFGASNAHEITSSFQQASR
ncbi:MAG: M48 family metalloprotease [Planctomycetota bacterium]|nr:M48 family metalloprotease [Planctomycetota bacterium]